MSSLTWTLILLGVGLNATAQLLLKTAARGLTQFSEFGIDTLRSSALTLAISLPFWAGMLCYAASVCIWIAALTRAPVSIAYPMLSVGYVVVAVIGALWLDEALTVPKVCGIALICGGVYLVSRSTT